RARSASAGGADRAAGARADHAGASPLAGSEGGGGRGVGHLEADARPEDRRAEHRGAVNFLCPACRTPLPTATPAVAACPQCGVEADLTRVDTAPGQAKLWPEVDLSGESLGNFKLISRAGSGGMGTVYVAEGLAGRCAVKVLSPQMAADPQLRERFRREAQALRSVLHKGIVRIIDEG